VLAGTALRRVYCQAVRDKITALAVPPILSAYLQGKHSPACGTEKLDAVFKFRIAHTALLYNRHLVLGTEVLSSRISQELNYCHDLLHPKLDASKWIVVWRFSPANPHRRHLAKVIDFRLKLYLHSLCH
jgi:hypothetical protein